MASKEDIAKLDDTLTKFGGNRSLTAQALGIPLQRVNNLIFNNPVMAAKWKRDVSPPPAKPDPTRTKPHILLDAEDDVSPPTPTALPPGVTKEDQQLAEAHKQIERQMQRLGWEGLGITGATAQLMESFERFTGGKILRTIDATHGGMMFGFAQTSARLDYLAKKLDDPDVKENPELEAMYHKQFMECSDQMRKFNAEATKAAHVRALIDEKARQVASKKRNKKPGWNRTQKVQPAAPSRTITIQ